MIARTTGTLTNRHAATCPAEPRWATGTTVTAGWSHSVTSRQHYPAQVRRAAIVRRSASIRKIRRRADVVGIFPGWTRSSGLSARSWPSRAMNGPRPAATWAPEILAACRKGRDAT